MSKKQNKEKEEIPQDDIPGNESAEKITIAEDDISEEKVEKTEEEKNQNIIKALEDENSSLKDQILRKQAESDNYRKRILREKEDSIKYGNSNLLLDLITIIDDFERAIKSTQDSSDAESFHSGIELIEKQFVSMLDRNWSLKRMVAVGEEFDPQLHEALGMEESSDYEKQTVLEDYQSGYILHDRVLRPAKVKVAMPKVVSPESETVSDK
ncbi:MAG: nucleotide exchange factor GrpE [Spirochaetia bacterium]|jgi:molecular chaperone GrpE|nr:nucleotide exchange factor GrpE [Spirochaetia bacterium]